MLYVPRVRADWRNPPKSPVNFRAVQAGMEAPRFTTADAVDPLADRKRDAQLARDLRILRSSR